MKYYYVQKAMLGPGWAIVDTLTGLQHKGPFATQAEAREVREKDEASRAAREAVAADRRRRDKR